MTTKAVDVPRLLVVDDENQFRQSLRRVLDGSGYEVLEASSVADAHELLAEHTVDLILCDIQMPGRSGLDLVRQVADELPDTGVVMVTGVDDPTVAAEALKLGAYGYLVKPCFPNQVLITVASGLHRRDLERDRRFHVEELESKVLDRGASLREAMKRLEEAQADAGQARHETVDRLVAALTLGTEETRGHIERLGRYAALIARRRGLDLWSEDELRIAAMLHDVGKIGVPDAMLLKAGPLSHGQRLVMQRHAEMGFRLLANGDASLLVLAATIALSHHERWDGDGYPFGLAGEDIPIEGRVVAIADAFDAMTSERVYRRASTVDHAVQALREGAGTQFDPGLVEMLVDGLDEVLAMRDAEPDQANGSAKAAVLILDEHKMFADALRRAITATGNLMAVPSIEGFEAVEEAARVARPAVVIVDSDLSERPWAAATRQLMEATPGSSFVLLTPHDDYELLSQALAAGCAGTVPKDRTARFIVDAVARANAGKLMVPAGRVIAAAGRGRLPDASAAQAAPLSEGERDILRLLAEGLSPAGIAERLDHDFGAVRSRIEGLFDRLGVDNESDAIVAGARRGFLTASIERHQESAEVPVDLLGQVGLPAAIVHTSSMRVVTANAQFSALAFGGTAPVIDRLLSSFICTTSQSALNSIFSGLSNGDIESCQLRLKWLRDVGESLNVEAWIGRLTSPSSGEALIALVSTQADHGRAVPLFRREATRTMLATVGHDWRFAEVSADSAELIGWSPDRLRGAPLMSFISRQDQSQVLLAFGLSSAEIRTMEVRFNLLRPDDSQVLVACEVSPLCNHTPPRLALAIRSALPEAAGEAPGERAARLEQHLARIALEVREAGLGGTSGRLGAASRDGAGWWMDSSLRGLTPRQWEVLQRALRGVATADIARELVVSESTVRNHLAAIYRRVGVHSHRELIARLHAPPA